MRAYLVVGPESAGNRIMAAALVRAGCHGEGSTTARYNTELPTGESPVAIIRSFPHGGEWPDLVNLVRLLRGAGYEVTVLVMVREPVALYASQVTRNYSRQDAVDNVRHAYVRIFEALVRLMMYEEVRSHVVPIEGLALNPEALGELLQLIGLPPQVDGPLVWEGQPQEDGLVRNVNAKHYR